MINPLQNSGFENKASVNEPSFTELQAVILNELMDLLIPASRDGKMPSARSQDLYADISGMPHKDRMLFETGLAEIQTRSRMLHGVDFALLDASNKRALIDELRAERAPFIQSFMTHTVARYLVYDRVMPLIGLEARAPWPKGHQVAQGDWSLIDVVRKRGKIYRIIE
jgi:hypothetical protein